MNVAEKRFEKYQLSGFETSYGKHIQGEKDKGVKYIDPDSCKCVKETIYFTRITQFLNKRAGGQCWGEQLKNLVFLPPTKRLPEEVLGRVLKVLRSEDTLIGESDYETNTYEFNKAVTQLINRKHNTPEEKEFANRVNKYFVTEEDASKEDLREALLQVLGLHDRTDKSDIFDLLWKCFQIRKSHKMKGNVKKKKIAMFDVSDQQSPELRTYLISDQLGFSAHPKIYKNNPQKYPLGIISLLATQCDRNSSKKVNRILERLTGFVINTRTLGGAFLWPTNTPNVINCSYNLCRGVANKIEDRVDLTLLEVKHYMESREEALKSGRQDVTEFYKSEYPGDLLSRPYAKAIRTQWLDYFKDFDEYVNFMMFDAFAVGTPKKPLSIFGDFPVTATSEKEIQKKFSSCAEGKNTDADPRKLLKELEAILNRVECRVVQRSKDMEEYLDIHKKTTSDDNTASS